MTCEVCPICYDPIEGRFSQFDCECKLFYCQECFNDLLKHNYECPVCQRGPNIPQIFMIWAQIIIAIDGWFSWDLLENTESYLLGFIAFVIYAMIIICSIFALLFSYLSYRFIRQYWNKFKRYCTRANLRLR